MNKIPRIAKTGGVAILAAALALSSAVSANAATPDTVKPVASAVLNGVPLTGTETSTVYINAKSLLVVSASDNVGLDKIVANIYQDGVLFKSTQVAVGGALTGTHTVNFKTVLGGAALPDGNYSIKFNALDTSTSNNGKGNVSSTVTAAVVADLTAPVLLSTSQVYETKEGGRVQVLQTFDGPVTTAPQGNYPVNGVSSTLSKDWTKAYYSTKFVDLTAGPTGFTDLAGNRAVGSFWVDKTPSQVILVENFPAVGSNKVVLTYDSSTWIPVGTQWYVVPGTNNTKWQKTTYSAKPLTVTFTDAIGNPNSYVVTPTAPLTAPPVTLQATEEPLVLEEAPVSVDDLGLAA